MTREKKQNRGSVTGGQPSATRNLFALGGPVRRDDIIRLVSFTTHFTTHLSTHFTKD